MDAKDLDIVRAEIDRVLETRELRGQPWTRTKKWAVGGGIAAALTGVTGALAWVSAQIDSTVEARLKTRVEAEFEKIGRIAVAVAQEAATQSVKVAGEAAAAKATAAEASGKVASALKAASDAAGEAEKAQGRAAMAAGEATNAAAAARKEVESELRKAIDGLEKKVLAPDSPVARHLQEIAVPLPVHVTLDTIPEAQGGKGLWFIETKSASSFLLQVTPPFEVLSAQGISVPAGGSQPIDAILFPLPKVYANSVNYIREQRQKAIVLMDLSGKTGVLVMVDFDERYSYRERVKAELTLLQSGCVTEPKTHFIMKL